MSNDLTTPAPKEPPAPMETVPLDTAAPPEDEPSYSDKAKLVGVDEVELTNWPALARPAEGALLALVVALLVAALNHGEWIGGGNSAGSTTVAGLRWATTGGDEAGTLATACAEAGHPGGSPSVACALASAGGVAGAFVWLSLCLALLLAAVLGAEHVPALQGRLPPPQSRLAAAPLLLWAAVALAAYIALAAYAAAAPPSLGAGRAALGGGYGLVRLALLVAAAGGCVHGALREGVMEDDAVELLDAMRSQWEHMGKKARASQCVMAVGVALNTLLWIHRPSWEGLLFVYGIGAQFVRSSRHCAVYASIVGFSVATDVLNILDTDVSASVFAATVQGLLLPVKIASIALVASLREALL
jgi:hypothetical protein